MGRKNINFNLLSLNTRGLRTFDRRKAFFNWLAKSSADICFLQETYSTSDCGIFGKNNGKVTCSFRMELVTARVFLFL